MWKRKYVLEIGGWDEALRKNQDGDLALRGLMNAPKITQVAEGHGIYRQHGNPWRVSNASIEIVHESNLKIFEKLKTWIEADRSEDTKHYIGLFAFGQAAHMYEHDRDAFGDEWLKNAEAMGVRYAGSTLLSRAVVKTVGLRNKTKFKRQLKRFGIL